METPANIDYNSIKQKLCLDRTKEGMQKRLEVFNQMDTNKNGFLSFSEVAKGIKDVLGIPEIYAKKEVIKKAFDAARDSVKNSKSNSKDFIEKNEFRYLLVYLRQFIEFSEMFGKIDNNGDKKINLDEFQDAVPTIERWGLKVADASKAFAEIDQDGSGKVRFDEFCSWAIKNKLDIEDDDDFTDDCLKNLK